MRAGQRGQTEATLRWVLSGEHEGELGLRAAPIDVAGGGAYGPRSLAQSVLEAAARVNEHARRWEALTAFERTILTAAFDPGRAFELECWGKLSPVVLIAPGTASAFRRYVARCGERPHRDLSGWLERLNHRVRRRVGQQLGADESLVSELRREADALLEGALWAYERARGRRRVTREDELRHL